MALGSESWFGLEPASCSAPVALRGCLAAACMHACMHACIKPRKCVRNEYIIGSERCYNIYKSHVFAAAHKQQTRKMDM